MLTEIQNKRKEYKNNSRQKQKIINHTKDKENKGGEKNGFSAPRIVSPCKRHLLYQIVIILLFPCTGTFLVYSILKNTHTKFELNISLMI